MRELTDKLYAQLTKCGFRMRMASIERLRDLREDIEKRRREKMLDDDFYRIELAGFVFTAPAELPEAQSVIIAAAPQPHTLWTFEWNGRTIPAIIPATYAADVYEQAAEVLNALLTPASYHMCRAWIPLKLTAVHSGLARYGKNNISYVDGMGSYFRLMAFFTDLPCREDDWGELQVMKECHTCTACKAKCPTGAISADRFLIHAERCLTYINEHQEEFPTWLDSSAHHCLMGCVVCQTFCPVNRHVPARIEVDAAFTVEETELFLRSISRDELPPDTARKFGKFPQFLDSLKEISRNLNALVESPDTAAQIVSLINHGGG